MPKRFLEGSTQSARAKQRQQLGSLRDLTVQPATKARYTKAVDGFLKFLKNNQVVLPKQRQQLDPLVCDYLEHLWSTGEGRALASDTVAGLQDQDAKLKGHLPGAWRLLKTWSINEVPNRAPPVPEHVVHAMAGWAFFHGHVSFGVSLLLGFYAMLRTGELLALRANHLYCDRRRSKVVVSLGFTKGGKRQGAAESCVIGYDMVVRFIQQWKSIAAPTAGFSPSPAKWRSLFNQSLESLHLQRFDFRPYSLRRGGATWWFNRHHSLDQILLQGRWQAPKTARIYINDGLAVLAELQLPSTLPTLAPFLTIFRRFCTTPSFKTLEPPCLKHGRSGGRGKKPKKGQQKRRKCLGKGDHVSLGEYHEEDLNSGWIARRVWPEAIWGVVTSAVTGLAEPTQNVLRKLSSDSFIYFLFKQLCCGVDVKQGPCVYSLVPRPRG